jgi:[histone H3]-lysine36 N-dimethyltransferase SETMAR
LKWEQFPHPLYSPDLASSDFHLFRSLSNYLKGKQFNDNNGLELSLWVFFESKLKSFYEDGIKKLVDRRKSVIENAGNYILD